MHQIRSQRTSCSRSFGLRLAPCVGKKGHPHYVVQAVAVYGDEEELASLDSFFYVFTQLVVKPRMKKETSMA